jgi:molybdenum cofactor cytidylyltransferase
MTLGFIFMASGFARRFGTNKLLHPFGDKPLYTYSLSSLIEAGNELKKEHRVYIAVVSQYEEILAYAEKSGLTAVHNSESAKGISATIKLGINNLPEAEHYAFFVADQPGLKPETTINFVKNYLRSGKTIGCVSAGNILGNPVIFDRRYVPELLALNGESGGKRVVAEHLSEVFSFNAKPEELLDVDSQNDISQNKLF